MDYPHHERCKIYGSQATKENVFLGKVSNYYDKISVMEFKVDSESFLVGDKLLVI